MRPFVPPSFVSLTRAVATSLVLWVSLIVVYAASGQTRVGLDVGYSSQYLWRGQTFIRGPLVHPAVFASFRSHAYVVTVGGWSIVDFGRQSKSGVGRQWFGEFNVWFDATARMNIVDISAGWTGYLLDLENARGLFGSREDTQELYLGVRIPLRRLLWGFTVWYDIDRLPGAYAEGHLAVRIPMWNRVALPIGSLWLSGEVGLNASKAMLVHDASDTGYFDSRGVTHVAFALSTTVGYVPLGVTEGALHLKLGFVRKIDKRVRLDPLGEFNQNRGFYFSMVATLAGPRCVPGREICTE